MFGQPGQLGVWAGRGEDLGIPGSDRPPTLSLKRAGHDRRSAALPAAADHLIDELHEIIWKPNGDLLAHTGMVPHCYQRTSGGRDC